MPKKTQQRRKITVVGLVTPVEWDFDDNVTEVALCCEGEEDYLITNRRVIKKMLKFVHQEVEVTGCPSENEFGEHLLDVEDLAPVREEDDDEDLEDEEEEYDENAFFGDYDDDDYDEEEDDDGDDNW